IAAVGMLWASIGWVSGGPLEDPTPVSRWQNPAPNAASSPEQTSLQSTGAATGMSAAPLAYQPMASLPPGCTDAVPPRAAGLGITGGAGIMFLQPRFSSNPALLTVKTVQGAGGTSSATVAVSTDFHWDQESAARFWLGITLGDNWMVRANYWNFRHSPADVAVVHAADPLNTTTTVATVGSWPFVATALPGASPPDLIHVSSDLRLDVLDLEGVYTTTVGRWVLQGALGLRHADLEQNYRAGLSNAGNPAALVTANFRDQSE